MLHKIKLSTRIVILGLLIVFCFSMVFLWLYPTLEDNMYKAKQQKTRHLVEATWTLVDHFTKKEAKGELTKAQAQRLAQEAVNDIRYEGSEYFWINDMDGVMVMHPIDPKLNGQNVLQRKDSNGKFYFQEFVKVAKSSNQGFVDYYFPKPGETKPSPKISYVKLVPQWNWIVGSGIYVDDVQKELNAMFFIIIVVAASIAALGILLSVFMARSIARPITNIIDGLNKSSDQVASAAGQVSIASQSLAEGSSEQSSSIEETSSSLEQMSAMTKQNAEHASRADELMKEAKKVVTEANESMIQLTESMSDISHASDEMSKIIKTIEEIAFQTNLLALNAAVEAARAGSAGSGFAVVAGEVRNLAIRAADAAKNTSEMLEETVSKISNGSTLVTETNEAFVKVSESAGRVGDLVSEIAVGSNEQAMGIDQVNQAVAQIGQVVQENAANAEESASASEEMNAQAEQMRLIVADLDGIISGAAKKQVMTTASYSGGTTKNVKTYKKSEDKAKNKREKNEGDFDVKVSSTLPHNDEDFIEF